MYGLLYLFDNENIGTLLPSSFLITFYTALLFEILKEIFYGFGVYFVALEYKNFRASGGIKGPKTINLNSKSQKEELKEALIAQQKMLDDQEKGAKIDINLQKQESKA